MMHLKKYSSNWPSKRPAPPWKEASNIAKNL